MTDIATQKQAIATKVSELRQSIALFSMEHCIDPDSDLGQIFEAVSTEASEQELFAQAEIEYHQHRVWEKMSDLLDALRKLSDVYPVKRDSPLEELWGAVDVENRDFEELFPEA